MTASSPILTAAQDEVFTDLELLQGAWTSVSGRRQAELLIAGRLFTVKMSDGSIYMGSFNLVSQERPKAMNMWIDEGPIRHKGKIALCVYALEGDLLRWCPGEPGSDQRPSSFPSVQDPHYLCLIFERQQFHKQPEHQSQTPVLARNENS